MTAVFGDTFYFLGLLNFADQHHRRIQAHSLGLQNRLVTTQWVLAEVADALSSSIFRNSVASFIRDLERDPKVKIVDASSASLNLGLELYESRPDKGWSLTDCISFIVMRDEGIRDALRADHHFEQAGFNALLK